VEAVARFLDPSSRECHWVRLVIRRWLRSGRPPGRGRRPFSRPIIPRVPLGSFGNTWLARSGKPDWLRLGRTTRPRRRCFSERNTSKLVLASFGETASRRPSPVFSTHHPESAIGFVWSFGRWVRSGERPGPRRRCSPNPGGHRNWYWLRLGKTTSWRLSPNFSTHHPESAIGFVWSFGRWLRSEHGVHRYGLSKSGGGDASIFTTSQNVARDSMKLGDAAVACPIGLGTLDVAPMQAGKPRMASQRFARS
jgi:hypothetical protein